MPKRLFFILALVLTMLTPYATAAVRIKVNAPRKVTCGENFRIEYYVSTRDVDDFSGPRFPAAINVVYGPSRSEMSSYQVINGKTSGSSSVTFTYTCTIDKPGTVTVPTATITIGGKAYRTGAITITATGHAARGSSSRQSQSDDAMPMKTGGRITSNDLFITVTANKTNVHEQEPVVLTYRVYTRVNLTQLAGNMPDLKGFLTQEVPLPRQKSFSMGSYKGVPYQTTTWCQYVMYPQQTGKLTIPSIRFDGVVAVANPNIDPFDAFFNGNPNFSEVKKSIIAPSLSINVSKLPEPRPMEYSGAVGHFDIKSSILTAKPRTGENLSVRVAITGVGNMKLITAPKLKMGNDFDVFPAKLTDKTKLTDSGMSGTMYYDYVVVPHQKGNYTLPSLKLCYFDTGTNTYKTTSTEPISFRVEQGSRISNEDEDLLRKDINDIWHGSYSKPSTLFSLSSPVYYMLYGIVLIAFIVAFSLLRRSEKYRSNTSLRLSRRAGKTAAKHLRKAARLLKAGDTAAFYDELASALLNYASQRLSIPMSEFRTDELATTLERHGVEQSLAAELVDVMKQCEFARYAPGDPKTNMENLYKRSSDAIIRIEDSLSQAKS